MKEDFEDGFIESLYKRRNAGIVCFSIIVLTGLLLAGIVY